jgi:hypothetical protein
MDPHLHRFAESLRDLVSAPSAESVEACWHSRQLEDEGWRGLDAVAYTTDPAVVPVLEEVDRLLGLALGHLPAMADEAGGRVRGFRIPALERLQHATAAALVAHRFGTAGLATVVADVRSPLARRYRAFVLLARLHQPATWSLIRRYLDPEAHYAFLGIAAEAARFYASERPAGILVELFHAIQGDRHLRAFLGPRLLASLFVLADPVALPLYRELAIAGHTDPDPRCCEVTHALVMLRRLTGEIGPSSKFADRGPTVAAWVDAAEAQLEAERFRLRPVALL